MTDRPIIFSAPMVRALLDGRKSQTRRLVKDRGARPEFCGGRYDDRNDPSNWGWEDTERGEWVTLDQFRSYRFVPYTPGDRLYVRESVVRQETDQGVGFQTYAADGSQVWPLTKWYHKRNAIPSIHMPRWASRLTLTVTDVRVQRLREISEADAKAEGLATVTKDGNLWKWGIADRDGLPGNDDHGWHWQEWKVDPRAAFQTLWNSIHGPDAWAANPWVVAVSFTVQRGNIDQIGGAA